MVTNHDQTSTVIVDEANAIDAVLGKDEVLVRGKIVHVPGQGAMASWALDALQRHSLYAPKVAYAGKEGVRARSVLHPFSHDIFERGYIRSHMDPVPVCVRVRAVAPPGKPKNKPYAEFVDVQRQPVTVDLPLADQEQMLDSARRLFTSFANRYAKKDLILGETIMEFGRDLNGVYRVIGFPGNPANSEITDTTGRHFDWHVLESGDVETYIKRFKTLLSSISDNVPVSLIS